ncbi:MAG TPA: ankyrin repeat domain-containing protein [Vicinamibacterales bacterium]|nr:ankyrin repeat domain-containing protein [Vicinamibacterales bacterium]
MTSTVRRSMRRLLAALIVTMAMVVPPDRASADDRLISAVKQRDVAAVRSLVQARADVNAPGGDGTTALHWAVQADDVDVTTVLIEGGANVTAANRLGVTPLALAATNGNARLIDALLKAGADPNESTPEGETVLMTASRTGSSSAVELLLEAGAGVNATESWRGETALMWAAAQDHAEVVTLLVAHGAATDARSRMLTFPNVRYNLATHATLPPPQGGFTALMFAARQGAVGAAEVLADAHADLNVQDPDGTPALTIAIVNGHHDVARLLLERGANPNVADTAGMTPLYAAVELHTTEMYPERRALRPPSGSVSTIELIRLLLAKKAQPDSPLEAVTLRWGRRRGPGDGALANGATPLMRAARFADVEVMRLLLDAGADPALKQKDQTTVLMLAAGAGWRTGETILGGLDYGPESDAIGAVKLCLERGADVHATDEDGLTALHHAVPRGAGVVQLLVDHGASVDTKDKRGRLPLDVAEGVRLPGEATRMKTSTLREASARLLRQLTPARSTSNVPQPTR